MAQPNIISIDGVELPAPMTYSVEYNDLDSDDSGRSEDGKLHRVRVRSKVAKIKVSWRQVDQEKADLILTSIAPESFEVVYYFGTQQTATMYAGSPSCELIRVNNGQAKWNIGFDLIEF